MTYDISNLDPTKSAMESSSSSCETCKCLTCESGYGSSKPCPKGNNCSICIGKNPRDTCDSYKKK